jgi:hypothetical protein
VPTSGTEFAQTPSYFGSKSKGIHDRKHPKHFRHIVANAYLTTSKLLGLPFSIKYSNLSSLSLSKGSVCVQQRGGLLTAENISLIRAKHETNQAI